MEFNAYLSSSFSSSSCPHSTSTSPLVTSSSVVSPQTFREVTVKAVLGNIISVIVYILFVIGEFLIHDPTTSVRLSLETFKLKCLRAIGTLMGAIHGAIIGKISEQGYFCGASFGAVSGAFLSVEVSETFLRIWLSNSKRIDSLLYLVRKFALDWLCIRYRNCNHGCRFNNQQGDILVILVKGELVRERLGPVLMINPQQAHMRNGTEIEANFVDMFEVGGGCRGFSVNRVQKIPMTEITSGNIEDSYGERIQCSVCLEEFQVGEKDRTLPCRNHMFHPSCIDQWLIKCSSCPLCRQEPVI